MSNIIIEGNKVIEFRIHGSFIEREIIHMPITSSHVVCNHCGKIYDLTIGDVTHRFGDCDVFTTPCCKREGVDTREWKDFPDYIRLNKYLNK